jgi:hypothetical protein
VSAQARRGILPLRGLRELDGIPKVWTWDRLLVYRVGCDFGPGKLLMKSLILELKKELLGRVIIDWDLVVPSESISSIS